MKCCATFLSVLGPCLLGALGLAGCAGVSTNSEAAEPMALEVAAAQDAMPMPQAAPEHKELHKMVGTWDATVRFPGQAETSKAVAVYRAVGEFWVVSDFTGEMMGAPFFGHGQDGYDMNTKKHVSTWVDSWSTEVLLFEGNYDKATRTMTSTGMGHDAQSGAPVKYHNVSQMTSDDSMRFTMSVVGPDGTPMEMMSIDYKRRK